jgi:hypothetical protein
MNTLISEATDGSLLAQEYLNLWRRARTSDAASTFTTFTTVTTVGSARGPETLGSFLDPA